MTIMLLIAGNSYRLGRRQSAAKSRKRKVQRLSREGVHASAWKWSTTRTVEDIVSSLQKCKAAKAIKALRTLMKKMIVSDSHCPANHLFMINLDHLHLFYHPKRNFSMEPWQKPKHEDFADLQWAA